MSEIRSLVIYVDVDDTFVRSAGTKRIPIKSTIDHIRKLYEEGAVLYCWSSGGKQYAKSSAEEFGIDGCFTDFLPKPNLLLDDQLVSEWRLCIEVHPQTITGQSPDQYWQRIKDNKKSF